MNFKVGQRYVTRDGHRAIIDEIAPEGNWRMVGRCRGKSAIWNKVGRYDRDGHDHALDLMSEEKDA